MNTTDEILGKLLAFCGGGETATASAAACVIVYIVAMNSDDLQKIKHEEEISGEEIFDPTDFIMPTRLSDDAGGGLFGIKF